MSHPVAVVLGGGRGIGAASALGLMRAGFTTVVAARTAVELDAVVSSGLAAGGKIRAVAADLATEEGLGLLFGSVADTDGRIDALVLAIGWAKLGGLREVTGDEFARMVDLHLVAPYRAIRRALPLLVGGSSTVVLIGSRSGRQPSPLAVGYGTSKAPLAFFVRSLAREFAADDVRVLAVNPGAVRTRLRAEALPAEDPSRLTQPAEIGAVVVGLCELKSRSLTGTVIDLPW